MRKTLMQEMADSLNEALKSIVGYDDLITEYDIKATKSEHPGQFCINLYDVCKRINKRSK